jgi:hypothetical protein
VTIEQRLLALLKVAEQRLLVRAAEVIEQQQLTQRLGHELGRGTRAVRFAGRLLDSPARA